MMKKLLLTAALLFAPATAHAQSAPALPTITAVTPNGQITTMTMPLNLSLLPAGTIQISEGNYYIANYQNTGINIYVQSPVPLRIASIEEMARYQAEWQRVLAGAAKPAAQTAPVPQTAPVARKDDKPATNAPTAQDSKPAAQTAPAPQTAPAARKDDKPATNAPTAQDSKPATQTAPAPQTAPAARKPAPASLSLSRTVTARLPLLPGKATTGSASAPAPRPAAATTVPATPVPPTPAPTFPAASEIFGGPTTRPAATPAAPAPAAMPASAPARQPQVTSPLQAPASKAAAPATGEQKTSGLPEGVRVTFNASGTTVRYSLMNTSGAKLKLDPRDLQVVQQGMAVRSLLTLRDSQGGAAGTLYPKGAIIGTIEADTLKTDPLMLNWQLRDENGKSYKLSYSWKPDAKQ